MSSLEPGPLQGRQHWMDLLRGAAILLVIVHHLSIVQQIWDGGTAHEAVLLSEATKPFRMPALLFASGILLPRSLEKPAGRFLLGKVRSLLWPWLLWSVLMLAIMGWGVGSDPLWWVNGMYTWFLLALFVYYVVGLLTRRIPPGWVALASLVAWTVMQMFGSALIDPTYRPDKFVYYAVFFFAGAALRRIVLAHKVPIWLLMPGLILALGWAALAARIDRDPEAPIVSQLVVLFAVLAAVGLAQRLPRIRAVRALEWLGRNSIVLYVVHLPVIEILARHLDLPPSRATSALFFLVTLGICVLAGFLRPVTGFLYAFPSARRAPVGTAQPVTPRSPDARVSRSAADGAVPRGRARAGTNPGYPGSDSAFSQRRRTPGTGGGVDGPGARRTERGGARIP